MEAAKVQMDLALMECIPEPSKFEGTGPCRKPSDAKHAVTGYDGCSRFFGPREKINLSI